MASLSHDDLQSIADYVMPSLPACASDLGFLFGTRHGVPESCEAAHALRQNGMFGRLLVSGGPTGSAPQAEADMIAERTRAVGFLYIPAQTLSYVIDFKKLFSLACLLLIPNLCLISYNN